MLDILACPLDPDRPPLRLEGDWLICTKCGYGFPVVDGIPNMLPQAAVPPEELEKQLNGR